MISLSNNFSSKFNFFSEVINQRYLFNYNIAFIQPKCLLITLAKMFQVEIASK